MKILLEAAHTQHTGKGLFARRLLSALQKRDVKVTMNPNEWDKFDVVVGFGKFLNKHNTKKEILRLGDVHKERKDYKKLNARKIKALKRADGVIYQSEYSKELCDKFLGVPKCPIAVIYNGANPETFDVVPAKSPYKYNFLASARVWNNNKRLRTIKNAFWKADIKNSCLWVCGDTGQKNGGDRDVISNREIRMLGTVDGSVLASLYKLCNAMVDITYLSACPNSVVEATLAGLTVIHANQGGIHEIAIGPCIRDKEYNYKPMGKHAPLIDVHEVAYWMRKCCELEYYDVQVWMLQQKLYISSIAKQYLEFFEGLLNG
ncbi:MAG: glycosyltransferase family 4 protein [PVC group bacterium]|nr:glycosyltransferase family 4 protein [PVC group bacterium]